METKEFRRASIRKNVVIISPLKSNKRRLRETITHPVRKNSSSEGRKQRKEFTSRVHRLSSLSSTLEAVEDKISERTSLRVKNVVIIHPLKEATSVDGVDKSPSLKNNEFFRRENS
ncbi:hypothetical protein AVEN_190440-1 [Araneus ventricosus]|uniref:Uncharacterized protein n=1 Tax=Araneus ventricosus TaxID=182803 RepID=A0A4Y2U0S9_ARAVE|nr:hypothetical protein AVEN_190440-1 [Araneus ventricosus]